MSQPEITEETTRPKVGSYQSGAMLKRYFRCWLAKHWPTMILSSFLILIVAGGGASYPWLIGQIVDALASVQVAKGAGEIAPQIPLMAIWGPVAVVIATFFRSSAIYFLNLVTNRIALSSTTALQVDTFTHLVTLDFGKISAEQSGTHAARFLNDINSVREAVLKVVNGLGRDIASLIFLLVVMFNADWQLALVALAIMPLASWPVIAIGRRLQRAAAHTQDQAASMAGVIEESLGAMRLVKTYGLENQESARVATALNLRQKLLARMIELRSRVEPLLETIGGFAIAGALGFAGWRISHGASSVGDLMAFITALLSAAQNVRGLGSLNTAVQEGLAALGRFYEVLDDVPNVRDGKDAKALVAPTSGGLSIDFSHVDFDYGDGHGLKNLSLNIEAGKTYAFVGPSGAGKTTLFNLICRLYDVSGGAINLGGQDVREVTLASLRGQIALLAQDAVLFDGTVRDNLKLARADATDEQMLAALDAAACEFVIDNGDGLAMPVGPRGNRLSGGQRQRLSLARAILRDAKILLLDEPTSALDAESEARVQAALQKLSGQTTILIIAHRLASVRAADQIVVMEDGQIIEQGKHDELVDQGGLYAQLARLQFQDDGRHSEPKA